MSNIIQNSQDLVTKYTKVLELYNNKNTNYTELAQIIEHTVSLIKNSYNKYETQYKIAGVMIMVKLYKEHSKFNISQIEEILIRFYKHFDDEYQKYIDSLVLINDRIDADLSFYYAFIKKEKES